MSGAVSGQIITFYSYKGGTGRTMALANVACLLAQRQLEGSKGVLMVDWDLEAPGLHLFFRDRLRDQFSDTNDPDHALNEHPGLIDLFWELNEVSEKQTEREATLTLNEVQLERFILETDIPYLHLLKAGRFDNKYSARVNTFQWEMLYNRSPELIPSFANRLAEQYRYVLIDSRTGFTDTSGICTMIMPEKLVVVFTPNRQSLTGLQELIERATNYRRQSDDLRPLIVFPLPSRIDAERPSLENEWRYGDSEDRIEGYQKQFEDLFTKTYHLTECSLKAYFDEVRIQHVSDYAYGEEIAVLVEQDSNRLSLARSYESFTRQLVKFEGPWAKIISASDESEYKPINRLTTESIKKRGIKAQKISVGLPFGLGTIEFVSEELAAWSLYVELTTGSAIQPFDSEHGLLRDALTLLDSLFVQTQEILKQAGPGVAHSENSFGPIAIEVLNKGIRPFTAKWHPRLLAHEQKRPADVSALEHERAWEDFQAMRAELAKLQKGLKKYANVLAEIAGAK